MATLEMIQHLPLRCSIESGMAHVKWAPIAGAIRIHGLPQLIWANAEPWREANLWALEQACTHRRNIKTVQSAMSGLLAYAKWLETTGNRWWDFPAREADRCLVRFRGFLMNAVDDGHIAASTAAQRMASLVRFYRWLVATGLLSPNWPPWQERSFGKRITDSFGFERTITLRSTDLSIPNRARPGLRLESGVQPVSAADRDEIIRFADRYASVELAWLIRVGFRTGMRVGTIADLRTETIQLALQDPHVAGLHRIAIGPRAQPPVATKFGVTGHAWMPSADLEALNDYIRSPRRLKRQALAQPGDRNLIFITRFGSRYSTRDADNSRALNVELCRLRRKGALHGVAALKGFHFHQTRATFATELARTALKHAGPKSAIHIVKDALLHKDEATTLRYIHFIERSDVMSEVADEFSRSFLGLSSADELR